jgi:hypothetical protein
MNQLCLYKSSSYRNILCLLFLDFASVANASYPLPYWNHGASKFAIVQFVKNKRYAMEACKFILRVDYQDEESNLTNSAGRVRQ